MSRFREFKDRLSFDPVSRQNIPPPFSIYLDRAVTHSQAILHPQRVWENGDAGDLNLLGPSRIVEMHATRLEACAYELQKLSRKYVSRVGVPVNRGIHHNHVKFSLGITQHPTVSVINHYLY